MKNELTDALPVAAWMTELNMQAMASKGMAYATGFQTCDSQQALVKLADAHALLVALLADLTEAAATLRRYEVLHRAKDTADSIAKAEVNAALAARFEATIAGQTPAGYKLVPLKATDVMLKAGGHVNSEWLNDNAPIGEARYVAPMDGVYDAFLAAAP